MILYIPEDSINFCEIGKCIFCEKDLTNSNNHDYTSNCDCLKDLEYADCGINFTFNNNQYYLSNNGILLLFNNEEWKFLFKVTIIDGKHILDKLQIMKELQ